MRLTALLVVAFYVAFGLYVYSEKQIDRANDQRHRSLLLADQLRQSADDLTRMARVYVVTGNPAFKQHFLDILDIRNGKKPMPDGYFYPYWDLLPNNSPPVFPAGAQATSLLDMLRESNFTIAEFSMLQRAKNNSDALSQIEFEAMTLAESAPPGDEKIHAHARQMLYGPKYFEAKAKIMQPIRDFYVAMDQRTAEAVEDSEQIALLFRYIFLFIVLTSTYLLWRAYSALHTTLGGTASEVKAHMLRIGKSDFSASIPVAAGMEDSVLANLASMQQRLYSNEKKIQLLTRIYATQSHSNQALIESPDEAALFNRICQIVVESGGMSLSWIGVLDTQSKLIRPVASFGSNADYLDNIIVSASPDVAEGRGPTGTAFREMRPIFIQEFKTDPMVAPWRERVKIYGWGSSGAIPIVRGNKPYAVLTFYSSDEHIFTDEIVGLLNEMAVNIGRGLDRFDLVAEQLQAEEQLRISAATFDSQEPILISDADCRILRVNSAFEHVMGYQAQEVVGKYPRLFQSGRHDQMFYAAMWQDILGTGSWSGEIWDKHKNGTIFPLEMTITAVKNEQGVTTQYIAIYDDISERKHTEAELEKYRLHLEEVVQARTAELTITRNAAESANRAKSEFLASMSHELRTPLNAILGYSQLMEMNPGLDNNIKSQAHEIEDAGKHLLALVNDLIDLARIEAGKIELSIEPVSVSLVAANSMTMVAAMAKKTGIHLFNLIGGETDALVVRADNIRLRQVLINLLSNAIKYNNAQGEVRLSCRTNNEMVRICITDTGPGIPANKQSRIFNSFDRLGKESGKIEGTGIGLLITKRIVEAMGGKIGFESTEGQGSTFWVELQAASASGENV